MDLIDVASLYQPTRKPKKPRFPHENDQKTRYKRRSTGRYGFQ